MAIRIEKQSTIAKLFIFGLFGILILATGVFFLYSSSKNADATLAGFNPGNIISDNVMSNKNSLSESAIQTFLKGKNSCSDSSLSKLSGYNSTQGWLNTTNSKGEPVTYYYNLKNGRFICMADQDFNGESAAKIIWQAAQDYAINPQVLIVLLQKEQGLVTDTWPNSVQYNSATGYNCPDDDAGCRSNGSGFKSQIRGAAILFSEVLQNKDLDGDNFITNYPVGVNYIQYNPTKSCGGSNVTIQNRATSALYRYTPYQPNAAALAAGWGTANCGAYGNRNFYNWFTDWFGSAVTAPKSTIYVQNGTYTLVNAASNRNLDITGGQTSNGTPIQVYNQNNTNAQRWQITHDGEGYYTLRNIASNKYLDVTNAGISNGSQIQLWDGNNSCAQKWSIVSSGERVQLLSKCSSLALDLTGGQTSNGTRLQLWDKNSTGAQLWNLVSQESIPVANGFYEISTSTNLSMEITGGNTANGTKVQIWNSNKSGSQQWQVTRQSDGLYTIRNPASGRYLDVVNASTTAGAGIQILNYNASCAQRWMISGSLASGFTLRSSCSDQVLDVQNGAVTTPGAQLQIWENNGSDAQKWHLTKTQSYPPNGTYSLLTIGGKSLEITGGNTANGTKVQIWNSNKSGSQQWQVTRQSDGLYTIRNPASGRYLDVTDGRIATSSQLQIWNGNSFCAQRWDIVDNNKGTFGIYSACSRNLAVEISGGAVNTPGARVQLYTKNGHGSQAWAFGTP